VRESLFLAGGGGCEEGMNEGRKDVGEACGNG
jgi:hypothetical protein